MKKIVLLTLLVGLLTISLVSGCAGIKVIGSGNTVSKTYDYSDFTTINAQNGMHVELTHSDSFSVEVVADDNVIDHIEVNKSGDTLRIKPKPNAQFRDATLTAKVTMPELHRLELSGGSHVNLAGFSSNHDLSVKLSGGSHVSDFITPSDITAGNVDFNLSGGSHVRLTGSADDLDIDCLGGSHIDLEGLSANNADINLNGGSHATINISGTLNIDISGGSKVYYLGNPKMGDIEVDWDSDLIQK